MPQRPNLPPGNRLSAAQDICNLFLELQESNTDEAFRNTMGTALISMLQFVHTNPSAAAIPPQLPISIAVPVGIEAVSGNVYVRDVRPLESPGLPKARSSHVRTPNVQSSRRFATKTSLADIEALLEKKPFRKGKVISFSPTTQRCTIETFDGRVIDIDPFVEDLLYVSVNDSGGIDLFEPEPEGKSEVIIESKENWPKGVITVDHKPS